jgi:Mg/Co/Ni transporter MgtE
MLVEELFPLATSTQYPIPVVDEEGRFLGEIHNETILDSMIQDQEKEEEAGA